MLAALLILAQAAPGLKEALAKARETGAVLLAFQDAPSLEELVRRLCDDSIEAREQAAAALAGRGGAARAALERTREGAPAEVRARIADVLARIVRNERIASLAEPTLVTLEARDRPLREVLAELEKASGTPVEAGSVDGEARVTVRLSRVPFWEALDRVCRAAGRRFDPAGDHVLVRNAPCPDLPGRIEGPLAAFWVRAAREPGDGGAREEGLPPVGLEARICWERRVRPIQVRSRTVEFADDRGFTLEDLRAQDGGVECLATAGPEQVSTWHLEYARLAPAARKLARVALEVSFDFALEWAGVAFRAPEGLKGARAACDEFAATLLSCRSGFGRAEIDLDLVSPRPRLGRGAWDSIWVHDKGGRVFASLPSGWDPETGRREYRLRLDRFYEIGEKLELAELHVRVPTDVHTVRFLLELRDVPLR
jgi:hypothetical protein